MQRNDQGENVKDDRYKAAHKAARQIGKKKTKAATRKAILLWCQFMKQALRS